MLMRIFAWLVSAEAAGTTGPREERAVVPVLRQVFI
jgi:hypothetical protein